MLNGDICFTAEFSIHMIVSVNGKTRAFPFYLLIVRLPIH